ncbi:MAG: hypothetical protein ACI4VF_07995 [Lachnospirales bacterium]
MVKLVISPEFFGINESKDKIKSELISWGVKEIDFTDDGFIVGVMNETQFEKFIISLKERVEYFLSKTKDKYNISAINHDNNFINFVVVCKNLSESDMVAIALDINMSAAIYQVFNGIPHEETTVIVNFKKTPKGKIIKTIDTSNIKR